MSTRTPIHIGKNIIGQFPSLKMNRMIRFESTIERDFIYILEYETGVVKYEEQPLTIEYCIERKHHRYTPDFKAVTTEGTIVVECKPESEVERAEYRPKFDAATAWCNARSWAFEVVTDRDIRHGHYLSNVKTVVHHARRAVAADTLKHAESALAVRNSTLHELASDIDAAHVASVEADLLCLVFHRRLAIDMTDSRISGQSRIELGERS